MKKVTVLALSILGALSGQTLAQEIDDFNVYGRAGLPGFGVGLGYALNDNLTLRTDLTTLGTIKRDFKQGDVDYQAKLKNDKINVMLDYFPFESGFRFTSGIGLLSTKLSATGHGRSLTNHTFKIGDKTYNVAIDGNDSVNAEYKYPAISPYIGLGFGHHIKQQNGGEWGFLFDMGLYLGKGKSSVSINDSLNQKLLNAEQSLGTSTAEAQRIVNNSIEAEKRNFADKVSKYKVLPAISIGVSYHF